MIEVSKIVPGSIIEMKKPHPCGETKWIVKRIGIDFVLLCSKCEREITIPRISVVKRIKKVIN